MERLWIVAALCAGCGRIAFDPEALSAPPDAAAPCASFGPFAAPVHLQGPLQTPSDDWFPAPTPDELELYYYASLSGSFDIAHATRASTADEFSAGVRVDELSTASEDKAPTLTADSLVIVFSRANADYDLFEARRSSPTAPFGTPARIVELSTSANELAPWLSPDGLRMLYVSSAQIFETARVDRASPWGTAVKHVELAVSGTEDSPTTSADGLDIWFSSKAIDWDIYTAHRNTPAGPFGAPLRVPELSSGRDDLGMHLSLDGRHLYYNYDTLYDGNGNADVWVATRSCL